jgi:hypothetical protein
MVIRELPGIGQYIKVGLSFEVVILVDIAIELCGFIHRGLGLSSTCCWCYCSWYVLGDAIGDGVLDGVLECVHVKWCSHCGDWRIGWDRKCSYWDV